MIEYILDKYVLLQKTIQYKRTNAYCTFMTNAIYVEEIASANKNQFHIHIIGVNVVYASNIFYHITNLAAHTTQ